MNRAPLVLLYLNVMIIATCGLIYELLAGTLASYVLGDSVAQFSFIIGVYLFALGVGAWISQFVEDGVARCFVEVELGVALLGGTSAPLLFLSFAALSWFSVVLYGVVFLIGVLVGLELPLLMRIVKEQMDFNDLISRVLAFDYIGALVASLLFPIFLVPQLGLVRTSLVFGILNASVGLWGTWLLRPILEEKALAGLRARAVLVIGILLIGIIKADNLSTLAEERLFSEKIVLPITTPYQRIVVTQNSKGFKLFLSGNLQFDSLDEYRYHEALVHPAMSLASSRRRVLVLGGGDGLGVREVLKHREVEAVTLVDIDPAMTQLHERYPPLAKLNEQSLLDPRVTIVNQDAMIWLDEVDQTFDAVIIDFPDPNSFSLGKLYTTRFYKLLKSRVTDQATIGIQCTSPLIARKSYWCILTTMERAGFVVRPYQVAVPSFGVWGFALAHPTPNANEPRLTDELSSKLRFLDNRTMSNMFQMPRDLVRVEVAANRLDNQILVRYYEQEWKK